MSKKSSTKPVQVQRGGGKKGKAKTPETPEVVVLENLEVATAMPEVELADEPNVDGNEVQENAAVELPEAELDPAPQAEVDTEAPTDIAPDEPATLVEAQDMPAQETPPEPQPDEPTPATPDIAAEATHQDVHVGCGMTIQVPLKNGKRDASHENIAELVSPGTGDDSTEGAPSPTPAKKSHRISKASAPKEKKTSALDAAACVLEETGQSMTTQEMIKAMEEKGYWTSPGGLTPHATLCSAILREISVKAMQRGSSKPSAASSDASSRPPHKHLGEQSRPWPPDGGLCRGMEWLH